MNEFQKGNQQGSRLGARETVEIEHDIRAGESPDSLLAERYDLSVRTIQRMRATMKKRGERIHAMGAEFWGTSGGALAYGKGRGGPWSRYA